MASRYKNFFSIILLSAIVILSAMQAHAEQITLAAFNYPPYMDESLPEKGLFCELVAAAYQSAGYDVSFEFYPGKRAVKYVIEGEVLASLGSEWNYSDDDRRNNVIESVRVFSFDTVGFYLKDRFKSISIKTLKDLQGYRISVIRGASASVLLKKHPDLNLKFEEVNTMDQLFNKVYYGRSDLAFTVELSGRMFIAKHYPKEQERWGIAKNSIQRIYGDVVFSRKYPGEEKYRYELRTGLQRIRSNGTYLRILEKYYGAGNVTDIVTDVSQKAYDIPKE